MNTICKPILFSTPMVKAILENRKTMTRRIVKTQPTKDINIEQLIKDNPIKKDVVLWVKETFEGLVTGGDSKLDLYSYKANDDTPTYKWKSPLYMPKVAARIFLKVINVRVERLNDISEEDSIKEGVLQLKENFVNSKVWVHYSPKLSFSKEELEDGMPFCKSAKSSFKTLWESINTKGSWNENPYVWVYEFERIDKPSDWNY